MCAPHVTRHMPAGCAWWQLGDFVSTFKGAKWLLFESELVDSMWKHNKNKSLSVKSWPVAIYFLKTWGYFNKNCKNDWPMKSRRIFWDTLYLTLIICSVLKKETWDSNDVTVHPARVISKLESQVKQLEHENQARARYTPHNNTQPSGAGWAPACDTGLISVVWCRYRICPGLQNVSYSNSIKTNCIAVG